MSAFEDFVNLELPKRAPTLTLANTGFDGDPNAGGAPAVVQNSPQGTYFFRNTGSIVYIKNTSAPGTWAVVGSGGARVPTTADLTWHVETTGNDATGDGSVGLPFLTTAGALTKLKNSFTSIEHQVDIVHGVGNFPGFFMSDVPIRNQTGSTPIGVRFLGTYVPATLTTGTTTGTVTSRVSGTFTARIGTGDTIGGTAPSMTLTDAGAAEFSADMVGLLVIIAGATTPANNGSFRITGFTSATQITYENAAGVAEAYSGSWTVRTVAFTSITDSGQVGWVVDELRGMFLRLITGTGSPTIIPILNNTATSITFLSTSATAGSVGGTFDIIECGSVLNTLVQVPPGLAFSGAVPFTPGNTVIGIVNPTGSNNVQITVEGLRIVAVSATANHQGIFASATPVQIRRCWVGGAGATLGARINLTGFANVGSTITQCILANNGVANSTITVGISLSQLTYSTVLSGLSTLATGYLPLRIEGQGTALGAHSSFSGILNLSITTTVMHPLSFGHFISNCLSASFSLVSWDWQSNLSTPLGVSGNTAFALNGVLARGPTQAYGLQISGPARATVTGLFGTGIQGGIRALQGSSVRIDPTTSIVGTREDILLNDTFSVQFDALRSLVPKSIQDQFETIIYEI